MEQLSTSANSAEMASKRCQQTLNNMQKLLDPDGLTEYKFKRRQPVQPFNGTGQHAAIRSPTLTPFAKMVYESTNIRHGYLTPVSSESPQKPAVNGTAQTPRVSTVVNGTSTPQQPTPSSQHRTVQAVVLNAVTPAQRAEYQVVSEVESSAGAQYDSPSHRRETVASSGSRALTVEQQHQADMASRNLQDLLVDIFQAEDQLQPDTSGMTSSHADAIFTIRETDEGSVPVLQPNVQRRLELFVTKAASYGRLLDLQVEDLNRVQKLCEGAVNASEAVSMLIGEDWSEQDTEEWCQKVGVAENGILAARTLIRIMIEGADQKELQSEEYLREALGAFKTVIEGCIVPVVEESAFTRERIRGEKDGPPPNPKFLVASSNRNLILSLLNASTKGLKLLGELLVKTDVDDRSISSVEYLCKSLIFAENASTERDSALGVQSFENIRRCAMDVLAKMFTRYSEQRQFIFDEIINSLEKLPDTKQCARQYRLPDAKPIQLVSALLMRLVQTSATRSQDALKLQSRVLEDGNEVDDSENEPSEDEDTIRVSPTKANANVNRQDLASTVKPLHDAARSNAFYIVGHLTKRAANTSKSSEDPYRRLLDIFTDDLLNVLGSSDWPAAELLLRALVIQMVSIIDNESSPVPSQTLALELLGTMGSGILDLQLKARNAAQSISAADSKVAHHLREMANQIEAGNADEQEILGLDGPYRIVVEYLEARSGSGDAQLQTAKGYHLMQWANLVAGGRQGSVESNSSDTPQAFGNLQGSLKRMLDDPHGLGGSGTYDNMTTAEGRLAAMILTLHSSFGKALNKIFNILISGMSSEDSASRVKDRSLRSVVSLVEKDPAVLTRHTNVLHHILRRAQDASPLVRSAALNLIEKCIPVQPALTFKVYPQIIARTEDVAVSVRKTAIKMLKDIYLRNKDGDVHSAIADAVIARIEDTEDSVVELARTSMEEIWFQPFYSSKLDGDRAVDAKIAFGFQASLLIDTVERSDDVLKVLESLLNRLLSTSKAAEANARVCKTLIAVLFDGVIDNSDIPGSPSQDAVLRSLTVFARASPKLFTAAQLERLEPYTLELTSSDDMEVYRSVITILRYVLPHQPLMNREILARLQRTLLTSVPKLHKSELTEVAACLWTVSGLVNDTERLAKFTASVLLQIYTIGSKDTGTDDKSVLQLTKLIRMVGQFGNACDFSNFVDLFRAKCAWCTGRTVPDLIVETLCPLSSPKRLTAVRLASLEAICYVSQAWPKQFLRVDVTNAFEMAFKEREASLEEVLVTGLEGFFKAQEQPDEGADLPQLGGGVATGTERLGRTYVASDQDGASAAMAQRFLSQIIRLALASSDDLGCIAARLLVSINKQGLVHPKESGPALVALETSPNKAVASEAFKEHKAQHEKYETVFDKEYMRAIQRAYEYQQGVVGDSAGFVGNPPTPKLQLTWEVLRSAKAGVRKKFLNNIAQKLDFDPSKMNSSGPPQHLLFVRFCLENLAFFEYDKTDDLLSLLNGLEKTFAGTGSSVAQAIESEVLKIQVEGTFSSDTMANGISQTLNAQPAHTDIDRSRLRQLAVSAQILTLIWETRSFILRLWNMQRHLKAKPPAKDVARAPNRSTHAPSLTEGYVNCVNAIFSQLSNHENWHAICSSFVELINVDNDVKVASDEDAEAEALANGYDTPSERSGKSPSLPPSGGGRGRKRKSTSANATPRKRGHPSLGKRKSAASKHAEDEDADGGWD